MFKAENTERSIPDESFLPGVDLVDVTSIVGKTFTIAAGTGMPDTNNILTTSTIKGLSFSEMLVEVSSMWNNLRLIPKIFIEGDEVLMLDPNTARSLMLSHGEYLADYLTGELTENLSRPVPGLMVSSIPEETLNTLTVRDAVRTQDDTGT